MSPPVSFCRRVGAAMFFVSSALASSAFAVSVTPATGVGADTFVQNGSTTDNSTNSDMVVKFTGTDADTTNRKAYIRFDTSTLPTVGSIASASLSLTVSINNGGGTGATSTTPQNFTFNVYGLNDGSAAGGGKLGEDWPATTITYANAPANNTASGSTVLTGTSTANGGTATLLGTFNVSQNDVAGTTVTALSGTNLVNFLNANTNGEVTFIITRPGFSPNTVANGSVQGNANSAFASAQSTTFAPPTLTANVPEPASAGLLTFGALGLLARRRR